MSVAISTFAFIGSEGTGDTAPVRADASGNYAPIHSSDSSSPHYSAGVGAFAAVATPTVFAILKGSATKTTRVKRITVSGAATAAGSLALVVEKCSDAGTLGSAALTTLTAAPHDSNNAAATAVLSSVGTANYGTVPTAVGVLGAGRIQMAALGSVTTSGAVAPFVLDFTTRSDQAVVLRGVAQTLTLSCKGGTIPSGGVIDLSVEWEEAPLDAA
jgi:hypothetical protein